MTKNEFLQQLLPRITGLPATEQQRILDYYNELVLDGVENGRSEEAIFAGFGSVEDAACKIWEDYAAPPIKTRSSGMRILIGVAWFFGGIIGFPLVLAAGVLYLCGWIVLLSLAITAVSLLLGGVASCAMMLAILGQAPQAALFQFGAGVLIIGLGILSSVGVFHLFRLYWVFSRRLSASISRAFARKGVRYAS